VGQVVGARRGSPGWQQTPQTNEKTGAGSTAHTQYCTMAIFTPWEMG